jgi:hypothetical protein
MSFFCNLPGGGATDWPEDFAGSERRVFNQTEFGAI